MKCSLLALSRALVAAALGASFGLSGCGGFKENDETAGWSAQKLYGESKDAASAGAWDKAVKYLEKLEARYPYGRFAQQAQLDIAYVHWKSGERALALAAADRFIKLYPNHSNVDYAYYLKGLVNFNENSGLLSLIDSPDLSERDSKGTRESFEAFKELAQRFPDSKYTEDALARMRHLVNYRAQYAVQNYPRAPATEEAVFIMVKAYDSLGMVDLRDAADRVMRTNFPQSKYLTGKATRSAAWWKLWDPDW